MTLQDDCTGYEFVLGEIHGLRWWKVDQYGRLNARTYSGVWSNGEQIAECKRGERHTMWGRPSTFTYAIDVAIGLQPTDPPKVETLEPKVEHVVPADDCTCGFYAFTDPTYDYKGDAGDVLGVIRGYGRTLIGAHGFRCAKAEVIALCLTGKGIANWKQRLAISLSLAVLVTVINGFIGSAFGVLWMLPGAAINAALGWFIATAILRRAKRHPQTEKLRLNYPDVPQYPTVTAMLKAHPLTPTLPPSPDNDPDFWTRP